MTDPSAVRETRTLFAGKSALGLALALLAGVAVVAGFGMANRPRVSALERFEEATAVGDFTFFKVPGIVQKPPPAAVVWNGQPLFPVSYKKVDLHDTKMIRTGRDPASGLTIYQSREPVPPQEGEREKKGEPFYFLKIGPNNFIKVRAWTPGM